MAGLGRKVWAADEILAADDLQNYIQDQVVFVFESSGARTSGILSPTEGMMSYLKDTNQISVYNGSAWVDIAPDVGTPGTYTKVTTDFKGRVTSGTTLSDSDLPVVSVSKGGTSATTALGARNALGVAGNRNAGVNDVAIGWTSGGGFRGYVDATDFGKIAFLNASDQITNVVSTSTVTTSGLITSSGGITEVGGAGISTSGGMVSAATYNQTNTGRAMFVASNGLFGIGASSRRFKENIVDADIDTDAVLKLAVRKFNYKKSFDETMPEDIGVIAEELVEIGLTDFVYFDADGVPDGVAYEKLALALIPLVQEQQSRLDALEARLNRLEK